MSKKHLPPTTKFGAGQAVTMSARHLPPPTKFGENPAAQPKSFALCRQKQEIATPFARYPSSTPLRNFLSPQKAPQRTSTAIASTMSNKIVIQTMRQMFPQEFNYLVVPTIEDETYVKHVTQRIRHCVTIIMKALRFFLWAKRNGKTIRIQDVFSGKAEAQASKGLYTTSYKLDAAHLMNITLRSDILMEGTSLSSKQQNAIKELRVASAATTPQLKENNVGPDKVIDKCMTNFVKIWTNSSITAMPNANTLILDLSNTCKDSLECSKNSEKASYREAIKGVTTARNDAMKDGFWVDVECDVWANENDFY